MSRALRVLNIEDSERDVELLKPLHLSHLRADLHLHDPAHVAELDRAAQACAALGCRLELALFVTDSADDELGALAPRLQSRTPIARFLVFHEREESTAGRWVRLRCRALAPGRICRARAGSSSSSWMPS